MTAAARQRLADLLDTLPTISCRGACAAHICRDLTVTELEAERIEHDAGLRVVDVAGRCSLLDGLGRCRAHDVRPLVCRLYGIHPDFPCEHGCRPSRWATIAELVHLWQQLTAIDDSARRTIRIGGEPDPAITLALVQRNLQRSDTER